MKKRVWVTVSSFGAMVGHGRTKVKNQCSNLSSCV